MPLIYLLIFIYAQTHLEVQLPVQIEMIIHITFDYLLIYFNAVISISGSLGVCVVRKFLIAVIVIIEVRFVIELLASLTVPLN